MASYTSTQSGAFKSAATWGGAGYPGSTGAGNSDTFTVAAAHTVDYDGTRDGDHAVGDALAALVATIAGTLKVTNAAGGTLSIAAQPAGASTYVLQVNDGVVQIDDGALRLNGPFGLDGTANGKGQLRLNGASARLYLNKGASSVFFICRSATTVRVPSFGRVVFNGGEVSPAVPGGVTMPSGPSTYTQIIVEGAGTGGFSLQGNNGGNGVIDGYRFKCSGLYDGSTNPIAIAPAVYGGTASESLRMREFWMHNCGEVQLVNWNSAGGAATEWVFEDFAFTSSRSGSRNIAIPGDSFPNAPTGGARRRLAGATFDKKPYLPFLPYFEVGRNGSTPKHNIYPDVDATTFPSARFWSGMHYGAIRAGAASMENSSLAMTSYSGLFYKYSDPTHTQVNCGGISPVVSATVDGATPTTQTFDTIVWDMGYKGVGAPLDAILNGQAGPSVDTDVVLRRMIGMYDARDDASINIVTAFGGDKWHLDLQYSAVASFGNDYGGVIMSHNAGTEAQQFKHLKNNLLLGKALDAVKKARMYVNGTCPGGAIQDVDYNGWRNPFPAQASDGSFRYPNPGYIGKIVNTMEYSPNPPGAHDTIGDPQLVDEFANLGRWYCGLKGLTYSSSATPEDWYELAWAELSKRGTDTWDARFTVQAYIDYRLAATRPTNEAFRAKGEAGTYLGPTDMAALSGTVTSVTVAPSSVTLAPLATTTLTATVVVTGGAAQTVTWSSGNTAAATVNASTGVVSGVAVGTATITATSTVDGSKTGTCAVTVAVAAAATPLSVRRRRAVTAMTRAARGRGGHR